MVVSACSLWPSTHCPHHEYIWESSTDAQPAHSTSSCVPSAGAPCGSSLPGGAGWGHANVPTRTLPHVRRAASLHNASVTRSSLQKQEGVPPDTWAMPCHMAPHAGLLALTGPSTERALLAQDCGSPGPPRITGSDKAQKALRCPQLPTFSPSLAPETGRESQRGFTGGPLRACATRPHTWASIWLWEKKETGASPTGGARACGTQRRKTEIPHGLRPGDTGSNPDSASYWLGEPVRQLKLPVQPAPSTAWRKDNTSPRGSVSVRRGRGPARLL